MKNVKLKKVVNTFLDISRLTKMSAFITAKTGNSFSVFVDKGSDCYCGNGYRFKGVVLGEEFYASIADRNNNEVIKSIDLKDTFREVGSVYVGAFYHEFFHLMYTDMNRILLYMDNMSKSKGEIVKELVNILEDATIERVGTAHYPRTEYYINYLKSIAFEENKVVKSLNDMIDSEPDKLGTMLAYLLGKLRGVDLKKIHRYKKYEDNKDFIEKALSECLNQIDPSRRVDQQVAFSLEILKIFDFKDNTMESFDKSFRELLSELADLDVEELTNSAKDFLNSVIDSINSNSNRMPGKPSSLNVFSSDKDNHDGSEDFNRVELTNVAINAMENDVDINRRSHFVKDVSKYQRGEYKDIYENIVAHNEQYIRQIVALFKKLKVRNQKEVVRNQFTGKFDLRSSMRPNSIRYFKREIAPNEESDLAFQIICDMSGSMYGSKAILLGKALIIFCEVLYRLKLPFSVYGFTENGPVYTIKFKDFEDNYKDIKYLLSVFITQNDIPGTSIWSGNEDEVNISYLFKNFKEKSYKDKVMLVMSDGMTCGSSTKLRELIKSIEKQNVNVLGIGLKDKHVKEYYSKNIILQTEEDMEGLAPFLNQYLINSMFK